MVPQVLDRVGVQMPWGSGALSATATQSPFVVARLQDMHAPVHAPLQHTPCAQKPDLHSFAALQLAPLGFRPQEALMQKSPATHWMLVLVQLV